MQSTPSFAAKEAYQYMADNLDKVVGIWHSNELALMTWVNKSEAIEHMRELSKCGLFKIDFDSVEGCGGTLIFRENPLPDEG